MKQSFMQGNFGVRPNRIVFNTYTLVGLIYCTAFTWIFHSVSPSVFLSLLHLAAFLVFLSNYFYLARTGNFDRATSIFLGAGLGVVMGLFATGGWQNTGYLWPLVYLVFVFFISEGNALRWIIYLYSASILVVLLHTVHLVRQPYSVVEVISYFAALGVITVFIYYFQKALTNYEAFLSFTRNLFEASVDPFFTIDRNGWITDANAALGEITGLPISRLVGTDFRNYFSEPEKADEIRSHVINEGPVRNYPLKLRHCRGGDIDVLLNASFYSDKTLGVERIFAIARDVTEQKKAESRLKALTEDLEEQVRRKTAELAKVFERVTVPFIALDREWRCTYINNRAATVLNTSTERLTGRNVWEEFPQGESALYNVYHRALAEQRYVHSVDYSAYSNRWFESDIYPSPDGISVFFNEITQQKKNEQALKNSYEKTQLIIDAALDAIICIDDQSRITEWNPQAERIFGWTKTEAMGRAITDLIIPEPYRPLHLEGMRQFMLTGNGPILGKFFETSALSRDGSNFPIEMTVASLIQNEEKFFCAFIRDITRRKKAEAGLQELNLTLKEQAAALTASNMELEQFAFLVSHDLQEPLRTISGFIQFLKGHNEGKLDDRANRALDLVFESSERMRVQVRDLLEYSRIGKSRQVQNADCDTLLRHVLTDLGQVIAESKATISYDDLPMVSGYPTELKLLFQNLISNSLKFVKKDVLPEIKITAVQKDPFWQFCFEDNGIGIEEKDFERIFDIFRRLHPRSVYQGSGIGLAHCKKIVEIHGGTIWVESVAGKGSSFYFTIYAGSPGPTIGPID